jgi:hypothetical protein
MSALDFLKRHLPERDRGLGEDFLREHVELATAVRNEAPCGMQVPDEVFLEYVLPYCFLDERRNSWRIEFHARYAELARRSASIEDAVTTLNRFVFDDLRVRYHPTRRPHDNMSPLESRAYGFASCTGLSIMLAAACRAVGIPARIAGTPMWADGSGNHSWVEVWDHGHWRFLGASEAGSFDVTWFNDRASAAPIFAARYSPGDASHFPLAWSPDDHTVPADDVSERYREGVPTPRAVANAVVEPRRYLCRRLERPIELTGRLDDPQWQAIAWTEDFVDIEGHRKPAPRFPTRAKMAWDDGYFYVGAELSDPHVWATLTEKNSIIFNDPDFEIFIDPDGDNHDYYEFEINALGTIWELWLEKPYRDNGPIHRGHNLDGVKTAVFVDGTINDPGDIDGGWSVEVAIPWKALARFGGARDGPPLDGDVWRVNFSRVHWGIDIVDGAYRKVPREVQPEDNWVWTPQDAIDMHRPEKWGYVEFATADRKPARDPTWAARELLMEFYYHRRENPDAEFRIRGVRDPALGELQVDEHGASLGPMRVDNEGRLTRVRAH